MKAPGLRKNRIPYLFLIVFFALAAVILISGFFYYNNYKKQFRNEIENQLSSIASLKVNQILQWRKERLIDANDFYKNAEFSGLVKRCINSKNEVGAKKRIKDWIDEVRLTSQYNTISLYDTKGIVVISSSDEKNLSSFILTSYFNEIVKSGEIYVRDFYRDEYDKRIYLSIYIPILSKKPDKKVIGVLALRTDPAQYLYPLINEWPIPSKSAETLLLRHEGNETVYLNELRFQKNTALNLRRPLNNLTLPAARAVLGKKEIMEGIDYRGVAVIAYICPIPNSPWFLVARIDKSEVDEPLIESLRMLIVIVIALLLGAAAIIAMIWRHQQAQFYNEKYVSEQELREREARYKTLVENIPQKILMKSKDFKWMSINENLAHDFGISPEEVVGKMDYDLFSKELADKYHADDVRIMETGNTEELEEKYVVDGKETWVNTIKTPVRDKNGEILGLLGIFWDITERKLAAAALKTSEERFRTAAESLTDVIYDWDIKEKVDWFGDIDSIMGFPSGGFPRTINGWAATIYPEDKNRVMAALEDHLKNFTPYVVEYRVGRKNGEWRWWSARGKALRDDRGEPYKMIGSITDITEHKKAEEQLKITMQNLERSNKELEQFAYVASHDLQEPLRMVSSYTQLLGKRYKDKLDQDANDFINFAVDGANRMQRLINDLLEYSRVTSRGKPLEKLDLSSVLGQVIATMQHKIQDTNAMVSNEDLPFIIGDEIQISRLFQNLIDNALKFKGEEPPRIHISSKFEGEKVIISFSDNGIGINEKFNDRVFTIFQRLHNREDYPGTGIGLAVCKRIIERHGGKIWLESEEGKGTTFYFTLNK
jgi:PAS domain S-box-containing protein